MRKMWLIAGLLALWSSSQAWTADFGFTPQDFGPTTPLQDYGQVQEQANRIREGQLRNQQLQQDLERRQSDQQQRQQRTYYCRTPGGNYVACR